MMNDNKSSLFEILMPASAPQLVYVKDPMLLIRKSSGVTKAVACAILSVE